MVFDPRATILEANQAWESILGYPVDHLLGLDAWSLLDPTNLALHQQAILDEISETGRSERVLRLRDAAGDWRDVQWAFYFDDTIDRSFGIGRDITEERERERVLKDSHRTFQQVGEFLLTLDVDSVMLSTNPALHRTLEVEPDDVHGRRLEDLVHPEDWPRMVEAAVEARQDLVVTERLTRWKGPDQDEWRFIDGTISFDPDHGRFHIVARDVTAESQLTAELERRAFTDELTGLANRARLLDHLSDLLAASATPAVLFCDLDRFKVVNDSLGHGAGDELLRQLGNVLSEAMTADDTLVARIGGDEFVVVLGDADETRAVGAAREVLAVVNKMFPIRGRMVHAAVSIGVTVARPGVGIGPGRTADDLLSEADTAAYRAKDLGRGRYVVHDESMRREAHHRFEVEAGLRRAIEENELEVHYQPVVALPGRGITGVEALVRWRAPDGGLRYPAEFLTIAQEVGLIDRIGQRVLHTAMAQGARLAAGGRPVLVAVNVAASQVADPGFAGTVVDGIGRTGLAPENLLIELTESAILAYDEATLITLERLRAAGVKIGLDDFGTGFSSLSHLRTLPIDVVKIDRSFVADLDDEVTRALTTSIVALSQALRLRVVFEGIETRDQLSAVEQLGGAAAQGFLFHPPLPSSELEGLLGFGTRPRAEIDRRTAPRL